MVGHGQLPGISSRGIIFLIRQNPQPGGTELFIDKQLALLFAFPGHTWPPKIVDPFWVFCLLLDLVIFFPDKPFNHHTRVAGEPCKISSSSPRDSNSANLRERPGVCIKKILKLYSLICDQVLLYSPCCPGTHRDQIPSAS